MHPLLRGALVIRRWLVTVLVATLPKGIAPKSLEVEAGDADQAVEAALLELEGLRIVVVSERVEVRAWA